jgi:hypothetical protein
MGATGIHIVGRLAPLRCLHHHDHHDDIHRQALRCLPASLVSWHSHLSYVFQQRKQHANQQEQQHANQVRSGIA